MSSSSRYSALRETLDEVLEISDFSIPTWLALGAGLQLLCASWLSARLSFLVPVLWLTYRALVTAIGTWRVSKGAAYSKKVMRGRWTSDLPELNRDGVVLLILCARLNQCVASTAIPRCDSGRRANMQQSYRQSCTRQPRDRRAVQRHVARCRRE